ncbi:MAG: thioredoxin family protein [Velocimicrobium sp.]
MGLFGFGKEKKKEVQTLEEVTSNSCCCNGSCGESCDCDSETIEPIKESEEIGETVKVLGSGCAKCNELEANVKKALEQLGMNTTIDHVTDFTEIAAYGVMSTPALVVDGKVVSYGKVLKTEDAVQLLKKVRG